MSPVPFTPVNTSSGTPFRVCELAGSAAGEGITHTCRQTNFRSWGRPIPPSNDSIRVLLAFDTSQFTRPRLART